MEVIVLLIVVSLGLATSFLVVFVWATRSGQFDDTTTPALRILVEDPPASPATHSVSPNPTHSSP